MSLPCKLVPGQYREYEYGLLSRMNLDKWEGTMKYRPGPVFLVQTSPRSICARKKNSFS